MISRLLKLFISLIIYIFDKTFYLFNNPNAGTLVILTYHSIRSGDRLIFKKHMEEVLRVGTPVTADICTPIKNKGYHIVVTFDDGFENVVDNGLPVLFEQGIPTTMFVTTGYLGRKPGWILDPKNENAGETIISGEQLKKLPSALIEVGSHSVTHPHLGGIEKDKAIKELIDSKTELEQILNKNIKLLSLPYGSYNKEILDLSRKVGYERIFLNVPTFPLMGNGEKVLGRIDVSLNDWPIEYRLKFKGCYRWLPFAIAIKRKLLNLHRIIAGETSWGE